MDMLSVILGFLVILNPFALFLYLRPIMQDTFQQFLAVFIRASLISFVIFLIFILFGDFIFEKIFRIFGGIILFSLAYLFMVKGQREFIQGRENLDDLASEITLSFMVGAGTVSLSILMIFYMKMAFPHQCFEFAIFILDI